MDIDLHNTCASIVKAIYYSYTPNTDIKLFTLQRNGSVYTYVK